LSDIILKFFNDQTFVTFPAYHCNFFDLIRLAFDYSSDRRQIQTM